MIQYKALSGLGRVITGVAKVGHYPDGTPIITERPACKVARIMVRGGLDELVAALFWSDVIEKTDDCELVIPFFPGARQDRLNTTGDALFTARSVAGMVNDRFFGQVTIFDPHSEVTPALVERCHVVTAAECISPPAGKYAAVISPDAGAEKRAGAVAKKLGVPLLHAWKSRDVATGAITGFGMESAPSGLVLVVDDICDGGGTFIGLADILPTYCHAHLFVTHGLFTQGVERLLMKYGHLYTTDSILDDHPDVIKINACQVYFDRSFE